MTKAKTSVRAVIVIPMPAVAKVKPRRSGTGSLSLGIVSLHEDIIKNMSSMPMPKTIFYFVSMMHTKECYIFQIKILKYFKYKL